VKRTPLVQNLHLQPGRPTPCPYDFVNGGNSPPPSHEHQFPQDLAAIHPQHATKLSSPVLTSRRSYLYDAAEQRKTYCRFAWKEAFAGRRPRLVSHRMVRRG